MGSSWSGAVLRHCGLRAGVVWLRPIACRPFGSCCAGLQLTGVGHVVLCASRGRARLPHGRAWTVLLVPSFRAPGAAAAVRHPWLPEGRNLHGVTEPQ